MSEPKPKQSFLGTFGAVIIACALGAGFITGNGYVAAVGVGAGVFILLYAMLIDRLDIIIYLLKQVIERQDSKKEGELPHVGLKKS